MSFDGLDITGKICVLQFMMMEERRLKLLLVRGLQRRSNEGKLRSNEVAKSLRHHIKHTNSHDKQY